MHVRELSICWASLPLRISLISLGLLGACSSKPPPPAAAPRALSSAESAQSSPLYELLVRVERRSAPLTALPEALQEKLQARLKSLGEPARRQLLADDQPAVLNYPLLYLAAGGEDIAVYELLYATSAGSDELVQLQLPDVNFQPLIAVTNQVAQAAANHVLRELAHDFSPGKAPKPELLQDVARAAQALDRSDIELLAREQLAQKDPRAAHGAELVQLRARRLELSEAQGSLERMTADTESIAYRRALGLVAALKRALSDKQGSAPGELAERARAYLEIGRADLALTTLATSPDSLKVHLGYATAYARASSGGRACPLVRPRIAVPVLCGAGWKKVRESFDFLRLKSAWESGLGRDPVAVEEYLGLMHVVPMTYGLGIEADANSKNLLEALESLETDARAAVTTAPYFEAVAVMARGLAAALRSSTDAASGAHSRLHGERAQNLLEGAADLRVRLGDDAWGQAAELATVALLMQEEDISAQLTSLEPRLRPELLQTFGALKLWQVVATGDIAAFEASKELLGTIVQDAELSSLARSRWLLLWAEAASVLGSGDNSLQPLAKMARTLTEGNAPLSMRLRAAIDLAGIQARLGNVPAALGVLDPIVDSTPRSAVANRSEQELLVAATGYRMVLRALAVVGAEREALGQELERFLLDVTQKGAAAPTLQLWLALWRGELAYLVAKESCGTNAACQRRAAKLRGISPEAKANAVGTRTAQLLSRGALPVGGVEIRFRYQPNGRLSPHVALETRFLLAHSPEIPDFAAAE